MRVLLLVLWLLREASGLERRALSAASGLERRALSLARGGATVKKIDPLAGKSLVSKAARPLALLAQKYDVACAANPKLELFVQLGGTLLVLSLLNRWTAKHGKDKKAILLARLGYCLFLAAHQWLLTLVQERVVAANDMTPLTVPVTNPLLAAATKGAAETSKASSENEEPTAASLLASKLAEYATKETTVRDYDLDMIKKGRTSELGNLAVMAYFHLRRGHLQPLVASTVMGFAALLKLPLVQIHLLGRDSVGALERPFKPPVPAWVKVRSSFSLKSFLIAGTRGPDGGAARGHQGRSGARRHRRRKRRRRRRRR